MSTSYSFASGVTAPGKVFYKTENGELVKRQMSLFVPERGEGNVVLSSENHTFETDQFFTVESKGRTVFYLIFPDPNHENHKKVFRGTYLRGSNAAVYYGDMYMAYCNHDEDGEEELLNAESIEAAILSNSDDDEHQAHYLGGFAFKSMIVDQEK